MDSVLPVAQSSGKIKVKIESAGDGVNAIHIAIVGAAIYADGEAVGVCKRDNIAKIVVVLGMCIPERPCQGRAIVDTVVHINSINAPYRVCFRAHPKVGIVVWCSVHHNETFGGRTPDGIATESW